MDQVFSTRRDIVVMIPKGKQREVEQEEAWVSQQEAAGNRDISYYWEMGRLPKVDPRRVYFVWDGAVRAFHEVTKVDRMAGRIYMKTEIHELKDPEPMGSFRGFRYYKEK